MFGIDYHRYLSDSKKEIKSQRYFSIGVCKKENYIEKTGFETEGGGKKGRGF